MNEYEPNLDDLLDRAIDAVKCEPAPPGPFAEVHAKTLSRLRGVAGKQTSANRPILRRIAAMSTGYKTAAAIAVSIGSLAFWLVLSLFSTMPNISYGDVADRIRGARNMVWTEAPDQPGAAELGTTIKAFFLSPGYERMEQSWNPSIVGGKSFPAGRSVSISDKIAGKRMVYLSANKTAVISPLDDEAGNTADDFVARFRKLPDGHGEPIADRQIGNVTARGFKVTQGNGATSLWVNPRTGLPILAEVPCIIGGRSLTLLFDVEFDQPLDESLFNLKAPPGYTLLDVPATVETAVIDLLRICAKHAKDQFPPRLDDDAAFDKLFTGAGTELDQDADYQQLKMDVAVMNGLLTHLKRGMDYDYTPADARLGDSGKVVFWYRDLKTASHRAIYGDLHAADTMPVKQEPSR